MEREQDVARTALTAELFAKLPQLNFYRFCQLLEQQRQQMPRLGATETPATDPVRFRPLAEMGFPSGEFKRVEFDRNDTHAPPTVRTTFLGLYGVDAVLPYTLIDDIVQRQEGADSLMAFLDIFNHRIMTQYYRIWLKHHYPASFESGGSDAVSQCLLGLAGFGIQGAGEQMGTPPSRFLALMGLMTQRTRTAEGLAGIVNLLLPGSSTQVQEFYPMTVEVEPTPLSAANRIGLRHSTILGKKFKDSSSTVHLVIRPADERQTKGLLPGGVAHADLLALLRAYLGYRFDVKLTLRTVRERLAAPRLDRVTIRLGYTSVLPAKHQHQQETIDVNLGRYVGLAT